MLHFWEVYMYRGLDYLICNARVNGRLSITSQTIRVLTKFGIRAILTVVTLAWSSLGYFGKSLIKGEGYRVHFQHKTSFHLQ